MDESHVITPDWLANADDDERAELGHLLGMPLAGTVDAELAATASQLLGALRSRAAELARHSEAERAEIARIQQRYAAPKEKAAQRMREIEQHLAIVAEGLEYGRKKTRVVGHGSVGFRAVPERVAVADAVALLAWATAHAPELIKVETKQSVPQTAVKTHLMSTGELPDGCEIIPGSEKFVYTLAEDC